MVVLCMGAFLLGQSNTAAQIQTTVCCCCSSHPSSLLHTPSHSSSPHSRHHHHHHHTRMLSQESQDLSSFLLFIPCPCSLPVGRCASAVATVWDGVQLIQLCLPLIGDPPRQGAAPFYDRKEFFNARLWPVWTSRGASESEFLEF